MDFVLIYEDDTGYCRIIVPDPQFKQPRESDESSIGRLVALSIPDVIEFIACKKDKIPSDLTFRDAWKKGDKHTPIKIDLDKAILIHRDRIKQACDAKISRLQHELQDAVIRSNLPQQVAIRATIKILGTLSNDMNLTHCKTPNDVKHSVPKELHDVWDFYPLTSSKET